MTPQAFWGAVAERLWNPSRGQVVGGIFLFFFFPKFAENP